MAGREKLRRTYSQREGKTKRESGTKRKTPTKVFFKIFT